MTATKKNFWQLLPLMVMVMLLALTIAPAMTSAQETDNVDDESPAFNNPAQAQKAENMAEAAAKESEDEELAERVDALEAAENDLAGLDPGDPGYQEALEAVENVEKDVVDRLSEISGELEDDIDKLREEGYGWGQIAHKLGINPNLAGLGNKYGHKKTERNRVRSRHEFGKKGGISAATARDFKTGWARGHGTSVTGKGKGHATADSFDSADSGKSKGNSGGKGNDKGNSGNNGKN